MPIIPSIPVTPIFQEAFGKMAFELMHHVFVIHDWGAGLELALYEETITHFLGGEAKVLTKVPITGTGGELATQPMRLLTHTPLRCIQWVNIHQNEITFTTIQ